MRIGPRPRVDAPRSTTMLPSSIPAGPAPLRTPSRIAPASLPPAISSAITEGATRTKSSGREGTERLLGSREIERLSSVLREAPAEVIARLSALIVEAPPIAQALILRATHARLGALLSGAEPMAEIERFAGKMKGLDDATLLARATVLDLDSSVSTSSIDPAARSARRGVIKGRGLGDERTDNDGLYQRFSGSCGPTVIHMMMAESDPVVAFALHEAGLESEGPDTRAARFQATLLEHYGSVPLLSVDAQRWSRFKNALGRLDDEAGARALGRYVDGHGKLTGPAVRALTELRARHDFPDESDLALLKKRPAHKRDIGIDTDSFADALARHLGARTGVFYKKTKPEDGFARGQAYRHLDAVERALERGIDVPFGIVEPAHWMLLSAVTGKKPDREFLVSDPWSGRTGWVTEVDLKSGVFAAKQFDLCFANQRGYIDCFYLPE